MPQNNTISHANIQNRLNKIAQELGYLHYNFIAFEPYKVVGQENNPHEYQVLSGMESNQDLGQLAMILIDFMKKINDKIDEYTKGKGNC